ncbi:MAG: NUDIX hydrolase N-terminal domain-containing protein [Acidimicrobiales bacterium]
MADMFRWSEALSAIARTGLGFTENLYERERFEEVLKVAADIRVAAESEAQLLDGPAVPELPGGPAGPRLPGGPAVPELPGGAPARGPLASPVEPPIVQEWMRSVGQGVAGYVTPKLAVGAVVGNAAGELLLVKRADSGIWLYPTGWADVGYSAAEVVVKEVAEETGIVVEPLRLIAVLDGMRLGFTRFPLYSLVFHCKAVGGELVAHPLECEEVGWFSLDALPSPLAGLERWGAQAFAALRGEPVEVLFDSPRKPPWREPTSRG